MNRIFSKLLACAGLVVAFISPSAFGASVWTGAAGDNNPANNANWSGGNPYNSSTKTFTSDFNLGADADWSATKIASLGGCVADLQGYSLKVSTFTSASTAGTVTDTRTDTTKPGTFIANVASGTWNNPKSGSSGLVLSGNLKLVKEGAGIFVNKMASSYTGGTVVNAGTIKSNADETGYYFGASGTRVTVNAGGTLEIAGKYGWHVHDIVLNGGTLANSSAAQAKYENEGIGNITLTADSNVSLKYDILIHKKAGSTLDLGGHTLTVKRSTGTNKPYFTLETVSVKNGTLAFGSYTRFQTYDADVSLADDVRVELNGCVDWVKKAAVSVGELISKPTASSDANLVTVTKKFSTNGNFDNVQLADGAVLDLTGNEGVFSTTSGVGGRTMSFADGATITVDISGRTFKEGEQVISWSAKPSATFKWDSETAKKGKIAVASVDGLYYGGGTDVIAIAHWTNKSGDGDIANASNWACTNGAGAAVADAVPTSDTVVHLSGGIPIVVPASTSPSVTWGGICLKGKLTGDFDLSGVTSVKFSDGASFDLNGHTVKLGPIDGSSSSVTVTDSKLEMEDSGALVLAVGTSQLFGGFETDPGIVVRVADGATLDLNGVNGTVFKAILEDGSTVANTREATGLDKVPAVIGGGVELVADATATFDVLKAVQLRATDDALYPIALNGGTLVKAGARVEIVNGDITGPGTIRVAASELYIGSCGIKIADDVVIKIDKGSPSPYLWAMGEATVPNIIGEGTVDGSSYYYTVTKRFSGLLTVEGKGVKFASGMTLDLKGNTEAYAIPSKVTMVENATITLDLSGRTDLATGKQIVSWTSSTAPSETVRFFVIGAPYGVVRDNKTGLYLIPSSEGLILGVR